MRSPVAGLSDSSSAVVGPAPFVVCVSIAGSKKTPLVFALPADCEGRGYLTSTRASNGIQALAQRPLPAVLGQLEEPLALGLRRHQLLRRDSLRARVRVVVVLPAAERLGAGIGGA